MYADCRVKVSFFGNPGKIVGMFFLGKIPTHKKDEEEREKGWDFKRTMAVTRSEFLSGIRKFFQEEEVIGVNWTSQV